MESTQTRRQIQLIFLASPMILMGIQLVSPALPVMQKALGLSDSQIGLVNSVFLLPSVVFAFVAGLLADRMGRRRIYAASLALFGLTGFSLAFVNSFTAILAIRLVQGAAFAAVAPLSITIIGDLLDGTQQIQAQSHRIVSMALADTSFPVIGGMLVGLSWHAPFAMQIIAVPIAIVAWRILPRGTKNVYSTSDHLHKLSKTLRNPMALSLELAGFMRFFFKFAFMTYLPILLVTNRGMTPEFTGIALGTAAAFRTLAVLVTTRLIKLVMPSHLFGICLLLMACAFAVLALLGTTTLPVLAACVMFGVADGVYGVLQNAAVTQVISPELRATFVASVASARNFGKFLAPSVLGLASLFLPLTVSFVFIAGLALLAIISVVPLRNLDPHLRGDPAAQPIS